MENKYLNKTNQKEIFEGLANKRMEEMENLRKQTYFNNLTYHCKGNTA